MPWLTHAALEIELLAERLHHELLQIAAERAAGGPCRGGRPCPSCPCRRSPIPHQGQQRGRVAACIVRRAWQRPRGGAGEHGRRCRCPAARRAAGPRRRVRRCGRRPSPTSGSARASLRSRRACRAAIRPVTATAWRGKSRPAAEGGARRRACRCASPACRRFCS